MIKLTKKYFKILSNNEKLKLFILVILMLIGGVMESISVSLILPLITVVTDASSFDDTWYGKLICNVFNIDNSKQYISVLILFLIFIFVLKNLYLLLEYALHYSYIASCRCKMQIKMMHCYIHKPYPFYFTSSTGELLRITGIDTGQAYNLLSSLLAFYTELIVSIALIITIFVISPQITIILGIVLLIEILLITKVIKPRAKKMGEKQRYENAMLNKWFLQSVNGIKSIKVANNENYFEKNYSNHTSGYIKADVTNQLLGNIPRMLIEACTVCVALGYIWFMINKGIDVSILIPQLSAFVVALVRLLPSVSRMSSVINQVPYSEGGLDNLIINLDADKDIIEKSCSKEILVSFNKEIRLDGITFGYSTDRILLNSVNLIINKGQSIGVIGQSGSGKTTLIDIILGLLTPLSGRVLVDGVDIEKNMVSWLKCISYIPQNIFLLDDSIRNNIAFGIEEQDVDDTLIWRTLEEAQLSEYVKSLPDGIDTEIGEQGIRLSGGQIQRIGIARALYSNPELLIFDEATSALDNDTEAAIMESIDNLKGKKTMIIIAHRLSTIENCDVVYKVDNGNVTKE